MITSVRWDLVLGSAVRLVGGSGYVYNQKSVSFLLGFKEYKADKEDPELLLLLAAKLREVVGAKAGRSLTVMSKARILPAVEEENFTKFGYLPEKHALEKSILLLSQAENLVNEGLEVIDKHYELLAEVLNAYDKIPEVELVK